MPGLLDFFTSQDPAQQQGLLGATAALLRAGGPSLRPISTGQGIADALDAYQQGTLGAQQQALGGLRLKGLQAELDEQERKRKREIDFEQAARDSVLTPEQEAMAGGGGPTLANLAKIPQMQGGFDANSFLNRTMGIDPLRALEYAQKLKKTGPEFDTKPQTGVDANGLAFQYIVAKDGTMKRLDGVLPRDEMKLANLGGKDVAYNPFALTAGQTFQRTMTPDGAAADRRARERLDFDKSQVGKPTFNAEAGGFITPPTAESPNGAILPLPGFKPKQPNAPVEFSKSAAGIVELKEALKNYQDTIGRMGGTRVLPGSDKGAELKAAYTAVQMGLKNAMELGALAGPDVEILGGMLVDPTSAQGLIRGSSGIKRQIDQTNKYLDNRTTAVEQVFGRKVPGLEPRAPKSVLKGQTMDGYRFKGGDPADPNAWEKL